MGRFGTRIVTLNGDPRTLPTVTLWIQYVGPPTPTGEFISQSVSSMVLPTEFQVVTVKDQLTGTRSMNWRGRHGDEETFILPILLFMDVASQ